MERSLEEFQYRFFRFKTAFEQFVENHSEEAVGDFRRRFGNLQKNYAIIKGFVDEADLHWSQDFNIFKILDRCELEVNTHTPFLAELLDPEGSHGQKNLFLKTFLGLLIQLPNEDAGDPNWHVQAEQEYIDLRVVNYTKKIAIFIENKVRTGAHSGQLSRYFEKWIEGYFKGSGAFIYLSPDQGKSPPSDDGYDPNSKFPKNRVMDVMCIWSYQDEIYRWLSEALPLVKSARVKETLRQYMDIISLL